MKHLLGSVLLAFVFACNVSAQHNYPLIENIHPDSSRLSFYYKGSADTKSVRLVSDLIPYFDNGTKTSYDNTGWLKNMGDNNWKLVMTVDNRLRIPYRYEITVTKNGKDSSYEVLDPLNTNVFMAGNARLSQSMIELPGAFAYPWLAQPDTASKWKKIAISSKIAGDKKDIFVYTPPGFSASVNNSYPLLIALGSFTYGVEIPTALIYESLLKAGKVKPAIIALIDYKNYNSQADFDSTALYITTDVLPYLRNNYHVSNMASDITVSGISRRGLVASYIGLKYDNQIGNVISLSGGFYWKPGDVNEFEWFAKMLANAKKINTNYYLAAGTLESVVTSNNAGHYMLSVNRHMRNILTAKNYMFRYEELPGAHNTSSWAHFLYNGMGYILSR